MRAAKGTGKKSHVVECGDILEYADSRWFYQFNYCPICGNSFEEIFSEETNE